MCRSNPTRRTIPTTSNPYYSTGGGYSYPTYGGGGRRGRAGSIFPFNVSKAGRNLIILIVAGLVIGFVTSLFYVNGIPASYYLIQINTLVYQGWIPPLFTSMIVVLPGFPGLIDVFFNAISVFFVDGILRSAFTSRQYYLVFVLTGLAGNVVSLFGYGDTNVASFGASGGIFGLVAGAIAVDYAINRRFNMSLVAWFVFVFIYSSIGSGIDVFAHLGGAVVGLAAGYAIGRSRRPRQHF